MPNALHAVVHEIDLAAAIELAHDGLADDVLVIGRNDRRDRQAILGRRVDHAHVAHAHERHVQRARDGGGGERQHVDLLPQLLQPLLVQYAKALLLIDDDQPQVLEHDIFLNQAMRADADVELPSARLATMLRCSRSCRKRDSMSTRTGKAARRSRKVL